MKRRWCPLTQAYGLLLQIGKVPWKNPCWKAVTTALQSWLGTATQAVSRTDERGFLERLNICVAWEADNLARPGQ